MTTPPSPSWDRGIPRAIKQGMATAQVPNHRANILGNDKNIEVLNELQDLATVLCPEREMPLKNMSTAIKVDTWATSIINRFSMMSSDQINA
jgi:hypothetical protein